MIKLIRNMCISIIFSMTISTIILAGEGVALDTTNFPDANFLEAVSVYDTDGDKLLSAEELDVVVEMNLYSKDIADLKGIEHFTELKSLKCSYNNLQYLDVSKNTKLTNLDCSINNIEYLDVSNCSKLENLSCYDNKLTVLDVTNNKNLKDLSCSYNLFPTVDLAQNQQLTRLVVGGEYLEDLDLTNNTALTILGCNYVTKMSTIDISKNTELQIFSCVESNFTELDISNSVALERLECSGNQLTKLDFTNNTVLEEVYCSNNMITTLDFSKCSVLDKVDCSDNWLTELDVSKCTKLDTLICDNNSISKLILKDNPDMWTISASYNNLACLNLKENSGFNFNIEGNYGVINTQNNSFDLDLLEGFDASKVSDWQGATYDASTNTLQDILGINGKNIIKYLYECNGTGQEFALVYDIDEIEGADVEVSQKNFPDKSIYDFASYVCDKDKDGILKPYEVVMHTKLDWSGFGASDLKGVEYFTELEELNCRCNYLTYADFSQNKKLRIINGDENVWLALDLSQNTNLETFTSGSQWATECKMNSKREVDMTKFIGFDGSKASNWEGATYDSSTKKIIVDEELGEYESVHYMYDCGGGFFIECAFSPVEVEPEIGDVNEDAKINAKDALLVLQSAASIIELDETLLDIADMNNDGSVNAVDALEILKTAAGII